MNPFAYGGFQYHGFLIYVIAMYTFYITVTAVIDMVKYRKYKSPILSITKVVKMAIYMIVQTTREIKQYKNNKECG